MDNASGHHSHRASARSSLQAGAGPVSNTTAGFTRLRTHRRHAHATAQPQAPAQAAPVDTASGPVTQGTDCVASPHACGFPDATNTGANCAGLAPSGPVTVTRDGAVVEGRNISCIHDLAFTSSSHNDGVQQNGGSNDVVKHNTIFNPHNQTSCVNFTTDFAGISGITITGNLLNGGNYTVYSRSGGNGDPTGVTITGNHFGGADVFGLLSADGPVSWSGNVSDATGQPVGQ